MNDEFFSLIQKNLRHVKDNEYESRLATVAAIRLSFDQQGVLSDILAQSDLSNEWETIERSGLSTPDYRLKGMWSELIPALRSWLPRQDSSRVLENVTVRTIHTSKSLAFCITDVDGSIITVDDALHDFTYQSLKLVFKLIAHCSDEECTVESLMKLAEWYARATNISLASLRLSGEHWQPLIISTSDATFGWLMDAIVASQQFLLAHEFAHALERSQTPYESKRELGPSAEPSWLRELIADDFAINVLLNPDPLSGVLIDESFVARYAGIRATLEVIDLMENAFFVRRPTSHPPLEVRLALLSDSFPISIEPFATQIGAIDRVFDLIRRCVEIPEQTGNLNFVETAKSDRDFHFVPELVDEDFAILNNLDQYAYSRCDPIGPFIQDVAIIAFSGEEFNQVPPSVSDATLAQLASQNIGVQSNPARAISSFCLTVAGTYFLRELLPELLRLQGSKAVSSEAGTPFEPIASVIANSLREDLINPVLLCIDKLGGDLTLPVVERFEELYDVIKELLRDNYPASSFGPLK